MSKKQVLNEEKMVERELHPSKETPDILESGDVMTIYWTLINGEPFSFVTIEETFSEGLVPEGDSFKVPHTFRMYGALYGKVYPWQVDLADLDNSRIVAVVKAKSLAAAQVLLFEKAESVIETVSAGKSQNATVTQKIAAWKVLRHIEALYDETRLKASWFTSRHSVSIKRIMSGLLSDKEVDVMSALFEEVQTMRRQVSFRWQASGKTSLQTALAF